MSNESLKKQRTKKRKAPSATQSTAELDALRNAVSAENASRIFADRVADTKKKAAADRNKGVTIQSFSPVQSKITPLVVEYFDNAAAMNSTTKQKSTMIDLNDDNGDATEEFISSKPLPTYRFDDDDEPVLDLTNGPLPSPTPPTKLKKKRSSSSLSISEPTAKKPKKQQINDWLGLTETIRRSGITSWTTVDPGYKNLAIMRMAFVKDKVRITHARVLDLDEVCQDLEAQSDLKLLANPGDKVYTEEAQLYALTLYVQNEVRGGGCFDSDCCIVEEQSFRRRIAKIEATIVATFNSVKSKIKINEHCTIVPGQLMSARSKNSAYRPFFPTLAEMGIIEKAAKRPFGIGNFVGDAESQKQHDMNKFHAVKFGSLIVAQKRFVELIPASNLSKRDVERLNKKKVDDLYDTLWLALTFMTNTLFHYSKIRYPLLDEQGKPKSSIEFGSLECAPQRRRSKFEELIEFCAFIDTPATDVVKLLEELEVGIKRLNNKK